jgi:hypothetical protein
MAFQFPLAPSGKRGNCVLHAPKPTPSQWGVFPFLSPFHLRRLPEIAMDDRFPRNAAL